MDQTLYKLAKAVKLKCFDSQSTRPTRPGPIAFSDWCTRFYLTLLEDPQRSSDPHPSYTTNYHYHYHFHLLPSTSFSTETSKVRIYFGRWSDESTRRLSMRITRRGNSHRARSSHGKVGGCLESTPNTNNTNGPSQTTYSSARFKS